MTTHIDKEKTTISIGLAIGACSVVLVFGLAAGALMTRVNQNDVAIQGQQKIVRQLSDLSARQGAINESLANTDKRLILTIDMMQSRINEEHQ